MAMNNAPGEPQSAASPTPASLVFLLDVDNTLLDNDTALQELHNESAGILGSSGATRFWDLYEAVRQERGGVDLPLTLSRFQTGYQDEQSFARFQQRLDTFPFADYLFPAALETLAYLKTIGLPVILSDGDSAFQPHKITNSGLGAAVDGRVLIYMHKEQHLADLFRLYPAEHYVMIDDKARILSALKEREPTAFTTVQVLQGKYAKDTSPTPPDLVLPSIADVQRYSAEQYRGTKVK